MATRLVELPDEAHSVRLVQMKGKLQETPHLITDREKDGRNDGKRFAWKVIRWAEVADPDDSEKDFGEIQIYDDDEEKIASVAVGQRGFEHVCGRLGVEPDEVDED